MRTPFALSVIWLALACFDAAAPASAQERPAASRTNDPRAEEPRQAALEEKLPAKNSAPAAPAADEGPTSGVTLYRADSLRFGRQAFRVGEARRQQAVARQLDLIDWMRFLSQPDGPYLIDASGGAFSPFEPWVPLPGDIFGFPWRDEIQHPLGHRITFRGPNAYTYEPVYDAAELDGAGRGLVIDESAFAPRVDPVELLRSAAAAFKREQYETVLKILDPLDGEGVDEPSRAAANLLRGQAHFALARYAESAAAILAAMQEIEVGQAGSIVRDFRKHYPDAAVYTAQLRALEKFVGDHPDNFSGRFLLGFHYGFLGHPAEAQKQLERAERIAPGDKHVRALMRRFQKR
jgi:tetratricopeptide (TPR) repeat protein